MWSFDISNINYANIKVYVGQSGRYLIVRAKEHLKKYKNTDAVTINSSLATDLLFKRHSMSSENVEFLKILELQNF